LNAATGIWQVPPGTTIYLRGGVYSGNFVCKQKGIALSRIMFKSYAGEHPIIDGNINFSGSEYIDWGYGIEHKDADFTNRSLGGIEGISLGTSVSPRIINAIVHDFGLGFAGGGNVDEYEIYGCIVYYCGFDADNGHGLYIQHQHQNKIGAVRNNIVFNNFGFGFHVYGSQAIYNFTAERNTAFANGDIRSAPQRNILIGGPGGVVNPKAHYNRSWHSTQREGFMVGWGTGNQVTGADIIGNVIVGNMRFRDLVSPIVTDNELYGVAEEITTGDFPTNTWESYTNRPDAVYLEANTYDADRAHLTIYNTAEDNTIVVDVSSVFNVGDSINVRNVQDYFTDIQTLIVAGDGTLTVNMQEINRTVSTPQGWAAPATTFPQFGAFVLERA
jgi:hypothetical protein